MLQRPFYQVGLLLLTVLAAAGGLWLLVSPSSSPGVEITIPEHPSAASLESFSPQVTASLPKKVNLNTATIEELKTLPKIDSVLAQRIVAYREQYGPFRRVDQIMLVERIGPATYKALRDLVTVEE